MSCTAPETYYRRDPAKFGGVAGLTKDARKAQYKGAPTVTVACGKCIQCRLARSREWSLRVMHELQTSGPASFVTLTYDDAHLPRDLSLRYLDFQLFMHRLRKRLAGAGRFLMCGEYGDDNGRPHYHAILFNCEFSDKRLLKGGLNPLYTSASLSGIWRNGHCSIGEVTVDSAGYVARYSLKKITGKDASKAYRVVLEDGTVVDRTPPFLKASNRPGIGFDWFMKFGSDAFPSDYLILDGRKFPVPRYYGKLQEELDAGLYERVRVKRERAMVARRDHPDNSSRRLMDRNIHDRLVSKGKRTLE